jgi:hypothetical protein
MADFSRFTRVSVASVLEFPVQYYRGSEFRKQCPAFLDLQQIRSVTNYDGKSPSGCAITRRCKIDAVRGLGIRRTGGQLDLGIHGVECRLYETEQFAGATLRIRYSYGDIRGLDGFPGDSKVRCTNNRTLPDASKGEFTTVPG